MSSLRMRRRGVLASFKPPPTLDLNLLAGALDSRITFTRASSATYFDATGTMQTAGTNVARFDCDPVTHAARGPLIEEARTNLLLNSATLGTQSVTVTATPYTLSFYGTGTVTLSGTSTAGPLTGTGAFPARVSLTFTPTAGTLTLTVTGSVLNANLEAGAFATSYITTTGASATRAADVATMPVGSWFNAAAGTWQAEVLPLAFPGRVIGAAATQAALLALAASAGFSYDLGGVVGTANVPTIGALVKLASTWTGGTGFVVLNGGAVAIGAQAVGFGALASGIRLMGDSNPGDTLSGTIRRVRYWPRALGAAELRAVTR